MKNQIRTSSNEIQRLIQEAIRARKNSVFSTDSEAGKEYKEMGYERPDSDRKLKDGWELKDFGTTGEPWKDNEESIWDKDSKRDKFARDEFGEEEKHGRMYDENPEGEENLYFGDPDMESDDEDEGLYERRQLPKRISLSESQLREFISYSVAQLLKESRPIYMKRNGEEKYEGEDGGIYGNNKITIEPDIDDQIDDQTYDALDFLGIMPLKVDVSFSVSEGMKGDRYMTQDDPDEYKVTGWKIEGIEKLEKYPQFKSIIEELVKDYMENDFDIEEEVSNMMSYGKLEEGNEYDDEDENDDEEEEDDDDFGGGWDASINRRSHEGTKSLEKELEKNKKNKGMMAHFPGKKKSEGSEIAGLDEGRRHRKNKYWRK